MSGISRATTVLAALAVAALMAPPALPASAAAQNRPPSVVKPRLENPPTACVTTEATRPFIADQAPVPVVDVTDPDPDPGNTTEATVEFEIRRVVDQAPLRRYTSLPQRLSSGRSFRPAQVIQPLSANTTYAWRARATDGTAYSAWTTPCLFTIDTQRPSAPTLTVETPAPYATGVPVELRFGPAGATDVVSYRYSVNNDAPGPGSVPADVATTSFTPSYSGSNTVRAWSYDRAGNSSPVTMQTIQVNDPRRVAHWRLDEGTGLSTADASGNNHVMYLGPNVTWTDGNKPIPADRALELKGLQTSGDTTATADRDLVDTSRSFAVVLRARPGIKSNEQVIVGEDHPGRSAFTVGISELSWAGKGTADPQDDDLSQLFVKWKFSVSTSRGPVSLVTAALPIRSADWASIAAVYDASTRRLQLYVDGTERLNGATDTPVTVPADAAVVNGSGPLRTGLGIDNSKTTHFYRGYLDDLAVYPGVISNGLIQAHVFDD